MLGSVEFEAKSVDGAEGSALKRGASTTAMDLFCAQMGLDAEALAYAMSYRMLQTMAPGGKVETLFVPQNPAQAAQTRDAVAKSVYSRLFDFLVARVNKALSARPNVGTPLQHASLGARCACAVRGGLLGAASARKDFFSLSPVHVRGLTWF